jgi:hypothetical protein
MHEVRVNSLLLTGKSARQEHSFLVANAALKDINWALSRGETFNKPIDNRFTSIALKIGKRIKAVLNEFFVISIKARK